MERGCVANAAGVITGAWRWVDPSIPSPIQVVVEPGGSILIFPAEADETTCTDIIARSHLWTAADVATELGITPAAVDAELPAPGEGFEYRLNTGLGTVTLESIVTP